MNNQNYLYKILILLGVVIITTSIADQITIIFPLSLLDENWVYATGGKLAEIAIVPSLGIIFVLLGTNLGSTIDLKIKKFFEVSCGLISIIFFIILSVATIFYCLVMGPVHDKTILNINNNAKSLLTQAETQIKPRVPQNKYNEYLTKINKTAEETKSATSSKFLKINIKSLTSLFFFIIFYLIVGIIPLKTHNILKIGRLLK